MLSPRQQQTSAPEPRPAPTSRRPKSCVPRYLSSSISVPASKQVQSAQDRLQSPLVSGGKGLQAAQVVSRSVGELRLHPVFIQLNLVGTLINHVVHGRKPEGSIPEPILITSSGIVISGVKEWHAALSDGRPILDCTEYQLNDDEALQLILTLQQSRGAWNAFTRIQIAMQQEPYLQTRAHANQVAGGKNKGLANLPEAHQVDVREEIAYLAGACPRNVSKVKTILKNAHSRLIEACRTGVVTIHRALQLCRLPMAKQVESLSRYLNERSSGKTIRQGVNQLRMEKMAPNPDVLLRALLQQEAQKPGSIRIRAGARKETLILIGQDYWPELAALTERAGREI